MSILLTGSARAGGVDTLQSTIPSSNTIFVDTLPLADYRSAKWIVTITDETADKSMVYEVLAVHKDPSISHSKYARTGDTIQHAMDVIISGSDMALEIANTGTNSIDVTVVRIPTIT